MRYNNGEDFFLISSPLNTEMKVMYTWKCKLRIIRVMQRRKGKGKIRCANTRNSRIRDDRWPRVIKRQRGSQIYRSRIAEIVSLSAREPVIAYCVLNGRVTWPENPLLRERERVDSVCLEIARQNGANRLPSWLPSIDPRETARVNWIVFERRLKNGEH